MSKMFYATESLNGQLTRDAQGPKWRRGLALSPKFSWQRRPETDTCFPSPGSVAEPQVAMQTIGTWPMMGSLGRVIKLRDFGSRLKTFAFRLKGKSFHLSSAHVT
jgi:hypothetical protein